MDVINITIEDANYNYLVFENNSQISSKITEMGIHCALGIIKIIGDSCQIIFQNGTTISASPTEADYIGFGEGAKEYWGTSHYKLIKDYYTNDNPMNWNKEKHPGYLQTQLLINSIYDSSKPSSPIILDDNCELRRHEKTYDIDNR